MGKWLSLGGIKLDDGNLMKGLTLTMLLALATPISADESNPVHDACTAFSNLAKSVMELRQKGSDIAKVMDITDDEEFRELVVAAFMVPRFTVEDRKQAAVVDFGNTAYLSCHEQWTKRDK